MAPVPTFARIIRKKSTEGFQCIPYSVALFSAMLTLCYALLKENNHTILISINSVGCTIECIYLIIYLYATRQNKDDYLDCFRDPAVIGKIGTDIEDFKCSWLVVKSLEISNGEQKKLLYVNHQKHDVLGCQELNLEESLTSPKRSAARNYASYDPVSSPYSRYSDISYPEVSYCQEDEFSDSATCCRRWQSLRPRGS